MALSPFIDRMRRRQLDTMLSECTITRPTGALTFADGVQTPEAPDLVFAGKCSPKPTGTQSTERRTGHGDEEETTHLYRVKLPWDADAVEVGDHITFTTSKDPLLVGRTYRIVDVGYSDHEIARVVNAVELLT